MSGADHLAKWCGKVCPGGELLVLEHTPVDGSARCVVSSWTREDIAALKEQGTSIGVEIHEAAEAHADALSEGCRFELQWRRDSGQVVRATIYHSDAKERAVRPQPITSPNDIIRELLGHIATQQRTFNGGLGATLAAFERALAMQDKILERMTQMQPEAVAEPSELDDTLSALKVTAFEKLIELGPDVLRVAIAAMGGGAPELPASNGQAGEASHTVS